MDCLSKQDRHTLMARVKNKNTNIEIIVRRGLFARGFRYRLNNRKLPGTPDITLPKYHCVIFVNGCFWHGHKGCKRAKLPATNHNFWEKKILRNIERDKENIARLNNLGWRVILVWQCELVSNKVDFFDNLENEIKLII